MELGASWTSYDFVGPRLVGRLLAKQSLYPHARPGASEYDHSTHRLNIEAPDGNRLDPDQIRIGPAGAG